MSYFAYFRGYICTANADGSIPLDSRVAGQTFVEGDGTLLQKLLDQANAYQASQDGEKK